MTESKLNITYFPSMDSIKLVDTITIKDSYFTAGDLIEALKHFDENTPVYVSNSPYGSLCQRITHEPDGTITLSNRGD